MNKKQFVFFLQEGSLRDHRWQEADLQAERCSVVYGVCGGAYGDALKHPPQTLWIAVGRVYDDGSKPNVEGKQNILIQIIG